MPNSNNVIDAGRKLVDINALGTALSTAGINGNTADQICEATDNTLKQLNHGDMPRWLDALQHIKASGVTAEQCRSSLETDTVMIECCTDTQVVAQITQALKGLGPWRKGPYSIADIHINTEWRSDWKWQRLAPHISPLAGRCVLDVGCGNGYHGWRMRGAGAKFVVGIDPSILFLVQFNALQHFVNDPAIHLLPLRMETLPPQLGIFDTVFSMGVLYHRRDHQEHLQQLRGTLKPGGELVLETLILPGAGKQIIEPATAQPQSYITSNSTQTGKPAHYGRYARMRNVWALPTAELLADWVETGGFTNIRTVNISQTSLQEQRTTEWMPFESLREALDPHDSNLTVEGWPAPTRALLLANRCD